MKWLLGLLLIPSALAALFSSAHVIAGVATHTQRTLPFVLGFFCYPLLRLWVIRPMRLYVLGHELSHVFAAWMSGAKVFDFRVGHKGGHVDLSHSNAWIALAPYIFPIYAVFTVLFYRLWLWWGSADFVSRGHGQWIFLLGFGLALSFHLVHTAEAIGVERQPDLDQAGGMVFSLAVVALLNGVVLIVSLKCLFPEVVSFRHSMSLVWDVNSKCWLTVFHYIAVIWREVWKKQ